MRCCARLVEVRDRPAHRPGPQDRPQVPARPAGERRERAPSCLEPFRGYIGRRFADDPHLDATVLLRELVDAGFERSYPTLMRELRRLELRPVCQVCQHRRGRGADDRDRASGRGGDPVGLARAARDAVGRAGVRAGRRAVALGPVPRGVLRADDFGHLAAALHRVLRRAGRHARGCGAPTGWPRSSSPAPAG